MSWCSSDNWELAVTEGVGGDLWCSSTVGCACQLEIGVSKSLSSSLGGEGENSIGATGSDKCGSSGAIRSFEDLTG